MMTENQYARVTGIMYLFVIIFAGFSQGYVRAGLVVPDDPVSTANNILTNASLFRWGFATDLTAFLLDAAISVLFYQLFKGYHKTLALLSAAFRLLAHPAIASINLLNHYLALEVLGGGESIMYMGEIQAQTATLFFMKAHHIGYLIAGVFFGVHCILLGILIYRSGLIPGLLGILMGLAGAAYLIESYGDFLFPGNEQFLALLVGISAALGEVTLAFYLLIKGVRTEPERTLRA